MVWGMPDPFQHHILKSNNELLTKANHAQLLTCLAFCVFVFISHNVYLCKNVQYSVFETVMNLPELILDLQKKYFENVLYVDVDQY